MRILAAPLVVLPLASALLHGLAYLLLRWASGATYGVDRHLSQDWSSPLGITVLALGGIAGGLCAVLGLYRLFLHTAVWIAVPFAALVYTPILFVAAVCDYVLLLIVRAI